MAKRKTCRMHPGYSIADPVVDERIKRAVTTKGPAQLEREAAEKLQDETITRLLREAREDARR